MRSNITTPTKSSPARPCATICVLRWYCHTFRCTGSDPFGAGTMQRPWDDGSNSGAKAQKRMRAAFEFIGNLGVPKDSQVNGPGAANDGGPGFSSQPGTAVGLKTHPRHEEPRLPCGDCRSLRSLVLLANRDAALPRGRRSTPPAELTRHVCEHDPTYHQQLKNVDRPFGQPLPEYSPPARWHRDFPPLRAIPRRSRRRHALRGEQPTPPNFPPHSHKPIEPARHPGLTLLDACGGVAGRAWRGSPAASQPMPRTRPQARGRPRH